MSWHAIKINQQLVCKKSMITLFYIGTFRNIVRIESDFVIKSVICFYEIENYFQGFYLFFYFIFIFFLRKCEDLKNKINQDI